MRDVFEQRGGAEAGAGGLRSRTALVVDLRAILAGLGLCCVLAAGTGCGRATPLRRPLKVPAGLTAAIRAMDGAVRDEPGSVAEAAARLYTELLQLASDHDIPLPVHDDLLLVAHDLRTSSEYERPAPDGSLTSLASVRWKDLRERLLRVLGGQSLEPGPPECPHTRPAPVREAVDRCDAVLQAGDLAALDAALEQLGMQLERWGDHCPGRRTHRMFDFHDHVIPELRERMHREPPDAVRAEWAELKHDIGE